MRRDAWWLELFPPIVLLGAFGIYATLRAFEGTYYEWGPYLSPFYSPLIDPHHRWWPFSPALLILVWPLGFRVTCYYYRKAYYRAFFPRSACLCRKRRRKTHATEERLRFPLFFKTCIATSFIWAFIFLVFLWHDAFHAFFFDGHMGVGIGTVVLLLNVILLTVYALSCHSLRHLLGGKLDCFSCVSFAGPRHTTWRWLSILNERHMLYAWISLIVGGSYGPLRSVVASGALTDLRLL